MLTFIWAEDEAHHIGYQGKLPWHMPADLKHFKQLTIGRPIIMGKNTFDSFPNLLPQRLHVVLTHHLAAFDKYDDKQVMAFSNLKDLKKWLADHRGLNLCVIGGKSLFSNLIDQADILEQTIIHHRFLGDVKMPAIDYSQFRLIKKEDHLADDKNKYAYSFLTYQRK